MLATSLPSALAFASPFHANVHAVAQVRFSSPLVMKAKAKKSKKAKGKKTALQSAEVGVVIPSPKAVEPWTMPMKLIVACEEAQTELAAAQDGRVKAAQALKAAQVSLSDAEVSLSDAEARESAATKKLVVANAAADSASATAKEAASAAAATKELEPVARAEAPAAATEAPPPSAAVAETPSPASKVEAPVSRVPVRPAEWNPQGLGVPPALPVPGGELFAKQFVPEYLHAGPAYLGFSEGTLPACIGFDPWALSVLAKPELSPQALQALDKTSRTAAERNERMLALSPEEQQEKVLWMRSSELKHGRLAMLAAAGWPMAEMLNGNALFSTGGRAPSLFNGGLPEYLPFLLVFLGGLSALEVNTKDSVKDGDYGFDPMGLAKGSGNGALRTLQTAEVKHGRAAMMAITGFAVQEFVYGTPVVQQTPFFFLPFGGFGRG